MEKRTLGQGLEVSALSLGAMGYGKSRDIPDRPEMIALLRKAVDLGMDFFDTAETYGPWTNEVMVGEAFRGMRDKVKIATKFGWDIDQDTGEHRGGVNSKPAQIRQRGRGQPEAARHRSHRSLLPAPRRPRRADGRGRGRRERPDRSRARFGISACRRRARNPFAAPMPFSRSPPCKANTRSGRASPRTRVIPTLEELGIGMVPFSPLGKGFLTGTIDASTTFNERDIRRTIPRFAPDARDANQRLVDLLRKIGERQRRRRRRSPSRGSLPRSPGSCRCLARASLNASKKISARLSLRLSDDDVRELNASRATIPVQGNRYPDEHMRRVGL